MKLSLKLNPPISLNIRGQIIRPTQFAQDLQELQQQLLEAAKDKKEVTSHDLGGTFLKTVSHL